MISILQTKKQLNTYVKQTGLTMLDFNQFQEPFNVSLTISLSGDNITINLPSDKSFDHLAIYLTSTNHIGIGASTSMICENLGGPRMLLEKFPVYDKATCVLDSVCDGTSFPIPSLDTAIKDALYSLVNAYDSTHTINFTFWPEFNRFYSYEKPLLRAYIFKNGVVYFHSTSPAIKYISIEKNDKETIYVGHETLQPAKHCYLTNRPYRHLALRDIYHLICNTGDMITYNASHFVIGTFL